LKDDEDGGLLGKERKDRRDLRVRKA